MIIFQKGRVGLELAVFWRWWRVRLIVRRSSTYTRLQVRHGYTLEVHIGPFNVAISVFGKRMDRRTRAHEDDHPYGEPYEPPEMAEILEG